MNGGEEYQLTETESSIGQPQPFRTLDDSDIIEREYDNCSLELDGSKSDTSTSNFDDVLDLEPHIESYIETDELVAQNYVFKNLEQCETTETRRELSSGSVVKATNQECKNSQVTQ